MKRLMFCVACCGVLFFTAEAQDGNLVPNPGFEDRIDCVTNDSDVSDAPPWFSPTYASTDVFHECAVVSEDPCPYPDNVFLDPWLFGVPTNGLGCQEAFEGRGYAGAFFANDGGPLYNEWIEYLGVRLIEPLENGQTYFIRFYVSLAETMTHSTNSFSIGFASDSISMPEFYTEVISPEYQVSAQTVDFITETEDWHEINLAYTATGNEVFMYVGNFTPYQELDLLQVVDEENWAGHYSYSSYFYMDNFYLGTEIPLSSNTETDTHFPSIYPNPASNSVKIDSDTPIYMKLYSIQGDLMQESNKLLETRSIDVADTPPGVYILMLFNKHHSWLQRLIVSR